MNPQRIEEFRRKLREGKPVRVHGGEVFLQGGEPGPPQTAVPHENAPTQQGVQVKPHEWGMEATAPEPFYSDPTGEQRALKEQALLAVEYPGFEMDVDDDGTPFVHGWIGPNAQLKGRYHVLVLIPPSYGHGVLPAAHILEPPVRQDAPHRFRDGSLCLDHSSAFTRR